MTNARRVTHEPSGEMRLSLGRQPLSEDADMLHGKEHTKPKAALVTVVFMVLALVALTLGTSVGTPVAATPRATVATSTTMVTEGPRATVEPPGCCSSPIGGPVPMSGPASPGPGAPPGSQPQLPPDAAPSTASQPGSAQPAKAVPARSLPFTGNATAMLATVAAGVVLIGLALLVLSRETTWECCSTAAQRRSRIGFVWLWVSGLGLPRRGPS